MMSSTLEAKAETAEQPKMNSFDLLRDAAKAEYGIGSTKTFPVIQSKHDVLRMQGYIGTVYGSKPISVSKHDLFGDTLFQVGLESGESGYFIYLGDYKSP